MTTHIPLKDQRTSSEKTGRRLLPLEPALISLSRIISNPDVTFPDPI